MTRTRGPISPYRGHDCGKVTPVILHGVVSPECPFNLLVGFSWSLDASEEGGAAEFKRDAITLRRALISGAYTCASLNSRLKGLLGPNLRGFAKAKGAEGTPTQSHISPSIL